MRNFGLALAAVLGLAACGGTPGEGQLFIDNRGGGVFDGAAGPGISETEIKEFVEFDVCAEGQVISEFTSSVDSSGATSFAGRCG